MFEDQAKVQPQPLLLEELIQSNDTTQIGAVFDTSPPVEIARMISSISKSDQIRLLEILGSEESAHLISKISGLGTGTLVMQLPTLQAVSIVKEMSRDQQAKLLRTIGEE